MDRDLLKSLFGSVFALVSDILSHAVADPINCFFFESLSFGLLSLSFGLCVLWFLSGFSSISLKRRGK